ncbi:hypothetical protein [Sorangium sp. So ce233]|uniref:hypothetical protein n=1 Tax=Sorangium sp. So ce233 TaxID=3133290 RepID=UPI003F60FA31
MPVGVSPFAPGIASPATALTWSSVAAMFATATAMDDPPGSVAFAARISKPCTFAPPAASVNVSATCPGGPSIVLFVPGLRFHSPSHV